MRRSAARRTLDIYAELLGNPTLESELVAAVERGVAVRLIAPLGVNGGTTEIQDLQLASLTALAAAGVHVDVSGPTRPRRCPTCTREPRWSTAGWRISAR